MNKQTLIKKPSLLIQFILSIVLIVTVFGSIIFKELDGIANYLLFSLLFVTMAYNNIKIYKRKYFTILYIIVSLIFFIMLVLKIYG